MWTFTGPSRLLPDDATIPIERVAAASLDEALKFMRRRYPDFSIVKAVNTGMTTMVALWRDDYNHNRPHSSLGYQTPNQFAAAFSSAQKPVLQI